MSPKKNEKRFILFWTSADLAAFKALAKEAAKLKPFGRVLLEVSSLDTKASHEIPEGGSSWHEYAVNLAAFIKAVPHPKLAPFVPSAWVKRNRELLKAKSAVLRRLGLGASFLGQEPYFVPEAFFRKHPHLRGPRVDHPRRSRQEEFSLCIDQPESVEMYEWMMAELKRTVPELEAYFYNANDAGSGFCWAAGLYPGPNGPSACRGKTAGQRVREFFEMLHRGAETGGGDVTVYIGGGNFWRNEQAEVLKSLPPNSYLSQFTPTLFRTGSLTGELYPVKGLINPLAVMAAMERFDAPEVDTVMIGLAGSYRREADTVETVSRMIEVMSDCIARPAKGIRARMERLHKLCERWGGREHAEALFEAFVNLDQALRIKNSLVQWMPVYTALTLRHLTRPLVIKPELLTSEEESYFLPHVFNPSEAEARTDYIDLHGSRMSAGSGDEQDIPAMHGVLDTLRSVATTFEKAKDAPAGEWLFKLGTATRLFVGCTRSTYNFYFGQLVRDKHREQLAQERGAHPKLESWTGEGEILRWNELMRDEMDNAVELIALLEERGLEQIGHTEDCRRQDTFFFGPDIVADLKKKVRIMRDHWLDVEKFLAPPHK